LVEMNLHLYSVEHSGDEILLLLSMFVDVICPTNKLAVVLFSSYPHPPYLTFVHAHISVLAKVESFHKKR
jgi:hypothetical protein